MKRILLFLCLTCFLNKMYSEDVLQIVPFAATVNITSTDKKTFDVNMVNDSKEVRAIQFTFYLPEGMAVAKTKSGNCVSATMSDRFIDVDDEENYYSVTLRETDAEKREYMVIANPSISSTKISGKSGVLMSIRFTTEGDMADGVYPIIMKDIIFSLTDKSKYTAPDAASYVAIGNTNPLETAAQVDLSGMTGYMPSFVVEQLNTDIASNTNLRSLNLSGTTFANLGAELSVPNNDNLLWYTSDKASLNRTFKGEQWNTVCLPFTLQTSYLSASTVVKEMADYDGEATITLGDVTTMETGKPYLIYSSTDGQLIKDVTISNPVAVSNEPSTTSSNSLTMRGTYQEATVKSDGGYTRYGFTNGKFVMLGTGAATVPPFRAYLEYLGKSSTRSINIAGDGTTGINSTISDDESNGPLYDLRGVMMNEGQQNKGIFVRNGKKQILK